MSTMITTFLAVAFASMLAFSGLAAIRFAGDRTKTALIGAGILAVEAVLLAAALAAVSSIGLFGSSSQRPWLDLELRPLVLDHSPAILGFLASAALVAGGYRLARRMSAGTLGAKGALVLPVAVLAAAAVFTLGIRAVQTDPIFEAPEAWRAFDPIVRANSSLPPGFAIEIVAPEREFSFPTSMALGADGELYVATGEGILVIDDPTGSGKLERVRTFAPDASLVLGMAYDDGILYAASQGSVLTFQDTNGDGRADTSQELISGLPHFLYPEHSNMGIAFGPDGRLFMTLGGTSDHGPEELDMAGDILVMNRDGSGLSIYAKGFRNPFDLAFCTDGRLFATDNGPDRPEVLENPTTGALVYRPPDELNLVLEGKNYGYPDFFGYPPPWSDSEPPVSYFPMSAVATGVTCYEADAFPSAYQGNLFVTLWGSLVIPEKTGHKLVRIELEEIDGHTVGTVHNFANLWRPIDVLVYTDGSLLVLDFEALRLYRISYVGE